MYYSINPAVIKSILMRMDKKQLQKEISFIESELEFLELGNIRSMMLRLRAFAKNLLKTLINYPGNYEFEF